MIRNLYFWNIARHHVGEPVATNGPDGVLLGASLLGLTVQTPDGARCHCPWSDVDYFKTGEPVADYLDLMRERAQEHRAALNGEPPIQPTIIGDELHRLLAEEPA